MGLIAQARVLASGGADGYGVLATHSSSHGFVGALQEQLPPHSSHPNFAHLMLLVFEAVLEVVFVSLPGYIVARQGLFDAEAQKFVANLNVMVFTPCLIFTKLASQLTPDKLAELIIIPFIFIVQTIVSYACATIVSKIFRFKKMPRNFVVAMGVFGNSNSLPISLVLSLAHTIRGLHWDEIPGDTDEDVAARGILYLMIFQQLGQLMRWTWGYNVLLKPADTYSVEEGGDAANEANDTINREGAYHDEPDDTIIEEFAEPYFDEVVDQPLDQSSPSGNGHVNGTVRASSNDDSLHGDAPAYMSTPVRGNMRPHTDSIRRISTTSSSQRHTANGHAPSRKPRKAKRPGIIKRTTAYSQQQVATLSAYSQRKVSPLFQALPPRVQKVLAWTWRHACRFARAVWDFMNPPLWSMLAAIVVASVPSLQSVFFTRGTFVNNSITSAIESSAGVAVPLILVVLGANLARNTLPDEDRVTTPAKKREERNLLIAAITSRMLLPLIFMAPLLALTAKFVPVSILDDPIFIVVCFLLTGAPSALQLAQICQINNIYMGAMSHLLFQSYVVWLLPSTLVLVTCALEVVEWASAG